MAVGVIDLGCAISMTFGLKLEQKFLPGSVGACNGAENWMNATDGTNLFVKLFEGGGYTDTVSICKAMMTTWIVNLVVVYVSSPLPSPLLSCVKN